MKFTNKLKTQLSTYTRQGSINMLNNICDLHKSNQLHVTYIYIKSKVGNLIHKIFHIHVQNVSRLQC